MVKQFEKDTQYSELDLDGDGEISDAELSAAETLDNITKHRSQMHMAWFSLLMLLAVVLGLLSGIVPESRIQALDSVISTLVVMLSGLSGAWMGVSMMTKR